MHKKKQKRVAGNPYEQFADKELIMRDHLAIDRTILANDRTFLAYCRTGLALALTGAGFLRFFAGHLPRMAGIALILSAIATMIIGVRRTAKMARLIDSARDNNASRAAQQPRTEPNTDVLDRG